MKVIKASENRDYIKIIKKSKKSKRLDGYKKRESKIVRIYFELRKWYFYGLNVLKIRKMHAKYFAQCNKKIELLMSTKFYK